MNLRQRGGAGAAGQPGVAIAAGLHRRHAFQRGRGRAQHHRRAGLLRAPHRQVAGVVAQAVLLLERAIVLFVHHNQPQLRQRGEHRQPGANHQPGAAFPGGQPGLRARAVGQIAVQANRRRVRKTRAKARLQLRGEVDFRHQHQRLAAGGQRLGNPLQIHFGFAAAGDAVQQGGGKPRPAQPIHHLALFVGQRRAGAHRHGCLRWRHLRQPAGGQPFAQQLAGLRMQRARLVIQRQRPLPQPRPQRQLARRPRWRLPGGAGLAQRIHGRHGQRAARRVAQRGGQRGEQGLPQRIMVVARGKAGECQPVVRQRRQLVQHRQQGAQLMRRRRRLPNHHPHQFARAKLRQHAHARRQRARGQIVEHPVQRHIKRHLHDHRRRRADIGRRRRQRSLVRQGLGGTIHTSCG